jgi:conjugative transfer pilus assembly protein TraH
MKTLMLLLVLFLPFQANAGLDEEMNGMFADMINATPGGYYETQRRGVIAGGSLVTRNKIMHTNLIS